MQRSAINYSHLTSRVLILYIRLEIIIAWDMKIENLFQ